MSDATKDYRDLLRKLDAAGSTEEPIQQRVRTPDGCNGCKHRQDEWRDSGWCYMFKDAPSPTCAQFKRVSCSYVKNATQAIKDGAK